MPGLRLATSQGEGRGKMMCPNCGSEAGFSTHSDYEVCNDTGYVQGDWLKCLGCRAETDYAELDRIFALEEQTQAKKIEASTESSRPDRVSGAD